MTVSPGAVAMAARLMVLKGAFALPLLRSSPLTETYHTWGARSVLGVRNTAGLLLVCGNLSGLNFFGSPLLLNT